MNKPRIYLDHGATTPVHPDVLQAMLPYWTEFYGNPSSIHFAGRTAHRGLDEARRAIAELLNAQTTEVIFTGCGSESDNLALRGAMWAARERDAGNHLIVSAVEHKAVVATAKQLERQAGFEYTIVPVDEYGRVSPTSVAAAIRPDTVLISVIAANNEIGTTQPVTEIGRLARERGILFHTDAVQAAPFMDWDMQKLPYDLVSFAPHKFYGPKGIGILYARRGTSLHPVITGGDQENGRRAGTSNVAFAAGAAAAFRLAMAERDSYAAHCQALRDRLIEGVLARIPEACRLTGHPTQRLPHNASFAFQHLSGNDLLIQLDLAGIAASSGSACATGDPRPSPILEAIGLDDSWTRGGLRFTVGSGTTRDDIDHVLDTLPKAVADLRRFSARYA